MLMILTRNGALELKVTKRTQKNWQIKEDIRMKLTKTKLTQIKEHIMKDIIENPKVNYIKKITSNANIND